MPALADLPTAYAVARWYPTGELDVNPQWEEFVEAVERLSPGWFLAGDPSLCPCRLVEARPVPSAADVAMQLSCWVALGLLGSQHDRPLGQVLVEAGADTWTLRLRLLHDRNRAPRIVGTLVTLRTEDAKEIGPVHPVERVTAAFLRWSSRRYKRERLKPEDLGIGVPVEEEAEPEGLRPRRGHRPDRPRSGRPSGEGGRHARPGGSPEHTAPEVARPGDTGYNDAPRSDAAAPGAEGEAPHDTLPEGDAPQPDSEYAATQVGDPAAEPQVSSEPTPEPGSATHISAAPERASLEGNGADAGAGRGDASEAQPPAASDVGGDAASDVPNASTSEAIHAERPPEGVPEASTSGTTT